jgi:hypothetical protein
MFNFLFEWLRGRFETTAGPELQKLTFRLVPVIALALSVYWLVPRFSFRDVASLGFQTQQQVRLFVEDVKASVNEANNQAAANSQAKRADSGSDKGITTRAFRPTCFWCTDYRYLTVPLTPLVNLLVKVPVDVYGEGYGNSVASPEYYPIVRADNIVLMFLILVGIALGIRAVRVPAVRGTLRATAGSPVAVPSSLTAEEFLESDVERAEERARDVYRRATILLGGGIIMAFVGVALFYLTLPSPTSSATSTSPELERDRYVLEIERQRYLEERYYLEHRDKTSIRERPSAEDMFAPSQAKEEHPWLNFAQHSLRPTGMLIFMEGIAWFLLRQYRVLIEEYKSFLRVYLRRSSYLIAWKAAASSGAERQFSIAQAMIGEDMSATLKKDETTEAIEALKMADPPPIIEVLREVKALIPKLNR